MLSTYSAYRIACNSYVYFTVTNEKEITEAANHDMLNVITFIQNMLWYHIDNGGRIS
jgi:hypothetical protein